MSDTPMHGVHARDLGSPELWEASLLRSQHRREIFHDVRRRRTRRAAGSLALSASMLSGTVAPGIAAAATATADGSATTESPTGLNAAAEGAQLLSVGSTGPTVASVQAKLRPTLPGIWVDGIYGPQTEGAVRAFQRAHGLPVSGQVDARTWSALFRSGIVFLDGRTEAQKAREAKAPPVQQRIEIAVPKATAHADAAPSAPEAGTTVAADLRTEAPAPAPAGDPAPPAPAKAQVETTADPAPPAKAPVSRPQPATQPISTSGGGSCGSGRFSQPVRGVVTGTFGESRPGHRHAGLDIAAPMGTAVRAAQCGTVNFAGQQQGYGNLVCIQHAGGVSTCYAHLSRFATSNGAQVHAGQIIGYVGCTGSCTGPHVHFEVRHGGVPEDPKPWLSGQRRTPAAHSASTTRARATSTSSSSGSSTRQASAARTRTSTAQGGPTASEEQQMNARQAAAAREQQGQGTQATASSSSAPAPAPAPTPAPAPAPVTPATTTPVATPTPAPAPTAAAPAPAPAPAPSTTAASTPAAATTTPAPAPTAAAPAPAPAPSTTAASTPAAATTTATAPTPAPAPAPEPVATPEPAPAPQPAPTPEPAATATTPAPAPAPEPAPKPTASASVEASAPAASTTTSTPVAPATASTTPAAPAAAEPADPAPAATTTAAAEPETAPASAGTTAP